MTNNKNKNLFKAIDENDLSKIKKLCEKGVHLSSTINYRHLSKINAVFSRYLGAKEDKNFAGVSYLVGFLSIFLAQIPVKLPLFERSE
ncbi:MAG: hypothetical protein V1872_00445, partial [bacterium]